jgi:hypothetical protein
MILKQMKLKEKLRILTVSSIGNTVYMLKVLS